MSMADDFTNERNDALGTLLPGRFPTADDKQEWWAARLPLTLWGVTLDSPASGFDRQDQVVFHLRPQGSAELYSLGLNHDAKGTRRRLAESMRRHCPSSEAVELGNIADPESACRPADDPVYLEWIQPVRQGARGFWTVTPIRPPGGPTSEPPDTEAPEPLPEDDDLPF